jgi:hypothetical protein
VSAGAFPIDPAADPLLESMQKAVGAIEVLGPAADGHVVLRLQATWGESLQWELGIAGRDAAADAWLAWRDLLA